MALANTSGGAQSTQLSRTNISSAQILALHTSPVTVVPAQGANTLIVPVSIVAQFTVGGSLYTAPETPSFRYAAGTEDICTLGCTIIGGNAIAPYPSRPLVQDFSSQLISDVVNQGIVLQNTTTSPTVGTGTLVIAVLYWVYLLS